MNPARAFERIAALPEWMIAYGLGIVLMLAVGALEYPAQLHVQSLIARAAHQTPIDSREFLYDLLLGAVVNPLIAIMLQAIAITTFAATRDVKNFMKYPAFVSLAANTFIIWALGELIEAAVIRIHNPQSFNDLRSLDIVLPLKMTSFADPANAAQANFLSHFGVFDTWSMIVLAFGLSRLAKIELVPSLIFVFALDFAFAFIT